LKKLTTLALVLGALVASCATTKPESTQYFAFPVDGITRTERAFIAFSRPNLYLASAVTFTLILDGKDLVSIGNGESAKLEVAPGIHPFIIRSFGSRWSGTLHLFKGATCYIDFAYPGTFSSFRIADTPFIPPVAPDGVQPGSAGAGQGN